MESRIDDLINHHDDVTDYVNRLKKERDQLERRKYTQSKRLKDAHKEMELIRGSLSYRLGNALITPIKTAGVIAKNPKAIKNYLRALKVKVIQLRRRMTPLKVRQLRHLRNRQRSALSYNGKKAFGLCYF